MKKFIMIRMFTQKIWFFLKLQPEPGVLRMNILGEIGNVIQFLNLHLFSSLCWIWINSDYNAYFPLGTLYYQVIFNFLSTVSAKGFDYDGLYVHFFLDLPESKLTPACPASKLTMPSGSQLWIKSKVNCQGNMANILGSLITTMD